MKMFLKKMGVKDNLFSHKTPEVICEMIDILVVIKIPDKRKREFTPLKRKKVVVVFCWGKIWKIWKIWSLLEPKEK